MPSFPSWLPLLLLAAGGPPPDWRSATTSATAVTRAGSSVWRLACSPGAEASFEEASGLNGGPTPLSQRPTDGGNGAAPGISNHALVTLGGGADYAWIVAWEKQAARAASPRDCSLSGQSGMRGTPTYMLHGASPRTLDRSDGGKIVRLVLDVAQISLGN